MRPVSTTKTLRIRSRCECTAPVRPSRYAFAPSVNAQRRYGKDATHSRGHGSRRHEMRRTLRIRSRHGRSSSATLPPGTVGSSTRRPSASAAAIPGSGSRWTPIAMSCRTCRRPPRRQSRGQSRVSNGPTRVGSRTWPEASRGGMACSRQPPPVHSWPAVAASVDAT